MEESFQLLTDIWVDMSNWYDMSFLKKLSQGSRLEEYSTRFDSTPSVNLTDGQQAFFSSSAAKK